MTDPVRRCDECGGDGVVPVLEQAHHPSCEGDCRLCPIPVEVADQCQRCEGSGEWYGAKLNDD
jgi:hypothetical protein